MLSQLVAAHAGEASMARKASSAKGFCSAVAWISTMPPSLVSTKLASASARAVLVIIEIEHRLCP